MEVFIAEIIFGALGFVYLFLRYRTLKKVKALKIKEYDGSYKVAGLTIVLQACLIILGLGVLALVITGLMGLFKSN